MELEDIPIYNRPNFLTTSSSPAQSLNSSSASRKKQQLQQQRTHPVTVNGLSPHFMSQPNSANSHSPHNTLSEKISIANHKCSTNGGVQDANAAPV